MGTISVSSTKIKQIRMLGYNRTDESSRNYVTMMCVDANDVNSEVYYSPTAGFGTYKVVIEAYVSGGEISGDVVVNQCKNAPADPLE